MKFAVRLLALGALCLLAFAAPASAQYMYLDSNGDGVHTAADVMNANGTTTTVDAYLYTDQNADGSTATCDTGDGDLTMNSYVVNTVASGGTVAYSNFVNQVTSFTIVARPFTTDATQMTVAQASGTPLAPGFYHLCTFDVTGQTGTPALSIVDFTTIGPDQCSFGSACSGNDFLNTYALNTDWFDTGNLGPAVGGNHIPVLSVQGAASGTENVALSPITATATDADAADILTISQTGMPTDLTFSSTPAVSPNTATISGTPGYSDQGPHTINWSVTDGTDTGSAATLLTIANTDRPPVVSAPASVSGSENSPIAFTVTASDPDGDAILSLAASPSITGATFTVNGTKTSGDYAWTPGFTQAGSYSVTFTATNSLTGSATTAIDVANTDRPPTMAAIADINTVEGSPASTAVSASDPDGDTITLTASLPSFATLDAPTSGAGSVSTTVTASPGAGDAGSYPSSVTATALALSATQNFTINVTAGDHPPVVAAISNLNVNEGATGTTAVSATDVDGDAITLTASLPSFATLDAPTSGTGSVSTTVTASPGFSDSGTYPSSVTATANALTNTANFQIIVANIDRPPTMPAISDINVNEGASASTAVSASDPDGDTINLTSSLPAFATLNAPTSGAGSVTTTVSASPGFSDAGTYPSSVTATSNALSATQSFQIVVANIDRPPVLAAISDINVAQGFSASTAVSATDPDGDGIDLTATLPAFAVLNAPTSGTGSVSTTVTASPSLSDAIGPYAASVTATALAQSDTKSFTINVSVTDQPPVLANIPDINVQEGGTGSAGVSATDPDGDTIDLTANLPSFAVLQAPTSGAGSVSTNVVATPGFSDSGTYPSSVTASSNTLSDTKNFTINVENVDRPVVLDPIANVTVNEGATTTAPVHASDPDGDAITLTASLPSFATLDAPTTGAGSVTTTVTVSPGFSDAGTYPGNSVTATTTGSNATQSFDITVGPTDRAPVVDPISDVTVPEGSTQSVPVTASDPDGDTITLTASLPSFATLNPPTSGAGSVSTTIDVSPAAGDAGVYPSSVTATANALSDTRTFTITATGVNHDPVVTAPASETVNEGVLLSFNVTATDADGDHVTLTASNTPNGAGFTDNGDDTGTFSWTPGFDQAGSYTVGFTGTDGKGGSGSASTDITVQNVNRPPTADAGGPYNGVINVAVAFDGTGSSDPDGDVLTFAWTFGDGNTGTGATVSHPYASTGTFDVSLTVTDTGALSATDNTTATIVDVFEANAFFVGGNKTTRLGAGKPFTCVQIEPANGSFDIADVDLSSIVMKYGNAQISAGDKTTIDGDRDHNGIQEISACFSKDDLRILFAGLPNGSQDVDVTIRGNLVTGGAFQAMVSMHVVAKSGLVNVAVAPNPLNPETEISFGVEHAGRVRVQVFDLSGRLVNTLSDQARDAGVHTVRWSGLDRNGGHVASGVYFVRVQGMDGEVTTPVTVLK
ncbi:MAG: Ig-like domain-containing protein [Hyphomicrobiales bacterium]